VRRLKGVLQLDAADLTAGYRLFFGDASRAEVVEVAVLNAPLLAY